MVACSAMTRRYRQWRADRRRRAERLQRLVAGPRVKSWSTRTRNPSLSPTKEVVRDCCAPGALIFKLPGRFNTAGAADGHNAFEAPLSTQELPRLHSTLFEDPFLPDFEDFVLKFCHGDQAQAELQAHD